MPSPAHPARLTRPIAPAWLSTSLAAALLCALSASGCELVELLSADAADGQGDAASIPGPPDDDNNNNSNNNNTGALPRDAQRLYDLIMAYRAENGLPAIPISPALTLVAATHVRDHLAHGDKVINSTCNAHSWSDQGPWTACCYTSDHAQAACMWNKPRELTSYTGSGFEISVWGTALTPESALNSWKGSPGHNNVILNLGSWDKPWLAIGVAIEGQYGHVWFGHEPDTTAP